MSAEIFDPFKQDEQIKMKHVIKLVNEFVEQHPDMPLVADTGDALFASVDIRSNECIAPAYYATMGFAVPAALGVQIASGRRPLVLVGDGAFQMTGSEISHARKYGCNPIVVLLNNSRWEMLQAFFPDARYNETVGWPFSKLAELWGGRGFRAHTPRQFRDALDAAFAEEKRVLADRGGAAARRHLADSSRVRGRGQDAGACEIEAQGRGQRAQAHRAPAGHVAARGAVDRVDLAACAALQRSHSRARRRQLQLSVEPVVDAQGAERARARLLSIEYLFSPFGVDLINHPHTALQGYISATVLGRAVGDPGGELYIIVSVFLNAACAYALAFDIVRATPPGAARGRRIRRLAVCRGASARPFRSADGVGAFRCSRCVSAGRCGPAVSRAAIALRRVRSAWRRTPRTTTSYISLLFAVAYTLGIVAMSFASLASHGRRGRRCLPCA